ncbi:hypothetical protein V5O48_018460, partial [Marasmius crinis-equi]
LELENCRPPSYVSGYSVMNEIRKVAQQYGRIKTCRGYANLSENNSGRSVALRSELQSSGLSMIDCPHNGRKNVVDQMIIADMLTFAIDNDSDGSTIILISGDKDFAYPISILRFRMYQVVVIAASNAPLSLRAQASAFVDWNIAILSNLKDDRSSVDSESPASVHIPLPPATSAPYNHNNNSARIPFNPNANFRPARQRSENPLPLPRTNTNAERDREPSAGRAPTDATPPVYAAAVEPAFLPSQAAPSMTSPTRGPAMLEPIAQTVYEGLQQQMAAPSLDLPPLPPSAPPGTPAPSSSQSQLGTAGDLVVPEHLKSLTRILLKHRENGEDNPLRSAVALQLVEQDPQVYEKAGVTKFRELCQQAIDIKLIWLTFNGTGGTQGGACISLHFNAVNKLRANKLVL